MSSSKDNSGVPPTAQPGLLPPLGHSGAGGVDGNEAPAQGTAVKTMKSRRKSSYSHAPVAGVPEEVLNVLRQAEMDEDVRQALVQQIHRSMNKPAKEKVQEKDGGLKKVTIKKGTSSEGLDNENNLHEHSSNLDSESDLSDDGLMELDGSTSREVEDPMARPFMCDLAYKCLHPSSRHELDFRPYHCKAALVFVDISGYSKLSHLPAHAIAEAVNGYFERVLAITDRFSGSVLSFAGDAVLILFPSIAGGRVSQFIEDTAGAASERGALFESGSNTITGACYSAMACALALQNECASHDVKDLDEPLGLHIGVAAGAFEMRVLRPSTDQHDPGTQRGFTFASGDVMRKIEGAVERAKKGQIVCTSDVIPESSITDESMAKEDSLVVNFVNLTRSSSSSGPGTPVPGTPPSGHLLEAASAGNGKQDLILLQGLQEDHPSVKEEVTLYQETFRQWKESAPVQYIANLLAPPPIVRRLRAGIRRGELAEMRGLVVLFVQMQAEAALTAVDVSTWFGEVFDVMTSHRCNIVQILDDDKGIHVVAAMNVFESEDGASETAIAVARTLVQRKCGVKIGLSSGPCFCGLIGSSNDYRWDITGAVCIRACRLMQYASVTEGLDVAIDDTFATSLSDPSEATIHKKDVNLKGVSDKVTVYTLSQVLKGHGTIACIAKINEFSSDCRRAERDVLLNSVMKSDDDAEKPLVASAIVAGTPSSGKKMLLLSAVDKTPYVPVLFKANRRATAGDVARGLSAWFTFHPNKRIREIAEETADACSNKYSTCSAKLAAQLVAATVEEGLHTAFIVDRAEVVDEASVQIAAATVAWGLDNRAPASSGKGRFLWLFSLTPRSGGYSIASLSAGLSLRVPPHLRDQAVAARLILPKAGQRDYNGIMNSFGYWYLTMSDRAWLSGATGGDPGLFRQFLSAMPEPWMGRWHEWREGVDGDKPLVFKESAEELAKVGFAVKKYFVNKHRAKFPSANIAGHLSTPNSKGPIGIPSTNKGPDESVNAPGGVNSYKILSDPTTNPGSNGKQVGRLLSGERNSNHNYLAEQEEDAQEIHRTAVYGTAYDDHQVPHPEDLACDILADGTWGISDFGRQRCIKMLGSIAAAFDSHRGSFFDSLAPHEQMLLKVIAALTQGPPPARALERVILNLSKRFLRVAESALPVALHAARDLLMIEELDAVEAGLNVLANYVPTTDSNAMSAADKLLKIEALEDILPGPDADPNTDPMNHTSRSNASDSLNSSGAAGRGSQTIYWSFRSPAQRHAIAAQVTPARVQSVCKTAAEIIIQESGDTISFATALDLLSLLHRSGELKKRNSWIRHLWKAIHRHTTPVSATQEAICVTVVLSLKLDLQKVLHGGSGGASNSTPQTRSMNGTSSTNQQGASISDPNALSGASQQLSDDESVGTTSPTVTPKPEGSDPSSGLTPPSGAEQSLAAGGSQGMAVDVVQFHAPSMPTVVENAKNMEPPLVLGPLGTAIGCLTRYIAHRTSQLSPQFMDRPHPSFVPMKHLEGLLDTFERVVPRIAKSEYEVKYTTVEELELLEKLYGEIRTYDEAMDHAQSLLDYYEKAVLPRARRVSEFANQLREFDVVIPDELTDETKSRMTEMDTLEELAALRRSFAVLKVLRKDTEHGVAMEVTRNALMALAVSNWCAPFSHSYMTPAKLRDALQWQWIEPLDLKSIVTLYLMDIAVRHKWSVSYLVDARLSVA